MCFGYRVIEFYYYNSRLGYKEKWGGPWGEKHMHIGARTTQRIEGFHAGIKHIIGTAGGIMKLFTSMHEWLLAHVSISASFLIHCLLTAIAHNRISDQTLQQPKGCSLGLCTRTKIRSLMRT